MIITIVNRSKTITDEQVLNVIRAINRQVSEDFEPYWSFGARLRLEGSVGIQADKQKLPEMRGDAILYLSDKTDIADALGYHEANFRGMPSLPALDKNMVALIAISHTGYLTAKAVPHSQSGLG